MPCGNAAAKSAIGADVAVSGARKLSSGESTRCNDSLASQGLHTAGMGRGWANAADSAISIAGSLGIGAAARATTTAQQARRAIANNIAHGHAFTEHGAEMGFSSQEQMASHIDMVLKKPSAVRHLSRGRTAYWHNPSQSVVIHNPNAIDGGTVFIPRDGYHYFVGTLK